MPESKIEITGRLRREGRWSEAMQWMDQRRSELRDEGASKQDANKTAWSELSERFPPLAVPEPIDDASTDDTFFDTDTEDADDAESDELEDHAAGEAAGPINLYADVEWVYANMENPRAKRGTAPNPGAWSMLRWAKQSPDKFFHGFLSKVLAKTEPLPVVKELTEKEQIKLADAGYEDFHKFAIDFLSRSKVVCPNCGTEFPEHSV